MTIQEIFVPFDIAKKLKENGFNEPCFTGYFKGGVFQNPFEFAISEEFEQYEVYAPTYDQVFTWFRQNHKLLSYIDDGYLELNNDEYCYAYNIEKIIKPSENPNYLSINSFRHYSKRYEFYQEAQNELVLKLLDLINNKT